MSERAIVDFSIAQRNERRDSGRMSNIKESQDHERTISEENREEMETEKPR